MGSIAVVLVLVVVPSSLSGRCPVIVLSLSSHRCPLIIVLLSSSRCHLVILILVPSSASHHPRSPSLSSCCVPSCHCSPIAVPPLPCPHPLFVVIGGRVLGTRCLCHFLLSSHRAPLVIPLLSLFPCSLILVIGPSLAHRPRLLAPMFHPASRGSQRQSGVLCCLSLFLPCHLGPIGSEHPRSTLRAGARKAGGWVLGPGPGPHCPAVLCFSPPFVLLCWPPVVPVFIVVRSLVPVVVVFWFPVIHPASRGSQRWHNGVRVIFGWGPLLRYQ